MINLNNFIIERLKLNKETKINKIPDEIEDIAYKCPLPDGEHEIIIYIDDDYDKDKLEDVVIKMHQTKQFINRKYKLKNITDEVRNYDNWNENEKFMIKYALDNEKYIYELIGHNQYSGFVRMGIVLMDY